MPKYGSEVIPVCLNCDRNSLTKSCAKCGVAFCKHFTSNIDIAFCANCVSDITIKESIIEKEVRREHSDGSYSFPRTYVARKLVLMNVDWLFINKAIEDSTDAEIEASIEYHKVHCDLMMQERSSRQLERSRKLASIKIVHTSRKSQHELEQTANKSKKKQPKETITTAEDLLKMLETLLKSGLSMEAIQALSGGKK